MSTAKAFAPGNVSGVFKIIPDDDPTKMHSLGMGFTVTDGVTVTVSVSDATSVQFNGTPIEFATVRSVVAKLGDHGHGTNGRQGNSNGLAHSREIPRTHCHRSVHCRMLTVTSTAPIFPVANCSSSHSGTL